MVPTGRARARGARARVGADGRRAHAGHHGRARCRSGSQNAGRQVVNPPRDAAEHHRLVRALSAVSPTPPTTTRSTGRRRRRSATRVSTPSSSQDQAVTESMGPIYDRTQRAPGHQRRDGDPHAQAADRRGEGATRPAARSRPASTIRASMPCGRAARCSRASADWIEATRELRRAGVAHPGTQPRCARRHARGLRSLRAEDDDLDFGHAVADHAEGFRRSQADVEDAIVHPGSSDRSRAPRRFVRSRRSSRAGGFRRASCGGRR